MLYVAKCTVRLWFSPWTFCLKGMCSADWGPELLEQDSHQYWLLPHRYPAYLKFVPELKVVSRSLRFKERGILLSQDYKCWISEACFVKCLRFTHVVLCPSVWLLCLLRWFSLCFYVGFHFVCYFFTLFATLIVTLFAALIVTLFATLITSGGQWIDFTSFHRVDSEVKDVNKKISTCCILFDFIR